MSFSAVRKKRAAVGFAEATLTLDNTDRALSYDADEVMVTRRYYRSGDSEYYINRQSVRLRDIHEMFMDTGLGREGYSNIGQGRIDEILSLKSADRREIFEEAAGISKYRHRKEETERKLAHTEDNLLRIGDKVSELELQLEPLKQQSEKALKYLELKEELQGVEVAVWLDSLEKLSATAKKAQEDYASASFVLQQAQEELDQLYARSGEYTDTLREKDEQLETLRIKVNMLEANHQQLDGQMAVLQGNISNNDANILRIQEELAGVQDRNGGVATQIAQAQQRVGELEVLLKEKHTALEVLQQELAVMAANAQGLTRQYLELRNQEANLSGEILGLEGDIHGMEAGFDQLQQRTEQLKQDMAAGKQRHQQAQDDLNTCRNALSHARQEVTQAENAISGYTLRRDTRIARRDALDKELRELNAKLDAVQAKATVFRAMQRDYESFTKSVRLVMQEADRGSLKGIHGPVSRLIRVQDQYTVAIEIALGAAMQQIVVSEESHGKAAIAFLKRTGNGRATFLPVSTIRARSLEEKGVDNCRGFVGFAPELVSCDKQYRGIVENLLGKTVIVQDLDAAIAMANKYQNRFKIVTLDGQVMNPGGSMTGGSVNKEAGILSRANELEKLENQEKEMLSQRTDLEESFTEAQRQADQVEYQMTTAAEQLRQAQDQVLRLEGEEKQHEILVNAIGDALRASEEELESLRQRHQSDEQRMTANRTKIQVFSQQLIQVRKNLEALESSQTEAADASARLTEDMTALRTEAAAMDAEKFTALAHVEDLRSLQAAMEGDREKRTALMESFREENARLEQQIRDLKQRQDENARDVASGKQELSDMLSSRANTEAEKTRSERLTQEKTKDIMSMERACMLLEQKKSNADMEEKVIVDKLWDSYGLTPGTAGDHRGEIESVAAGNRRISELKRKISLLGTPNLGAIEEYARVNERYSYLTAQQEDVLTSKRELESIIRDITKEMTTIFVSEFEKIDHYFGKVFEEMFGGGKGQLVLEDPNEPLTCGIEIRVQPPGKQLKTITLLSGGEKAFVAIALYFAILKVRPTPFCMLDEIDAALDDRNVERFASYLRNLSRKTQFIIITHRRGTMEASDVLYGVTMQEQGISKLLRLDLNQMEEYLGIEE